MLLVLTEIIGLKALVNLWVFLGFSALPTRTMPFLKCKKLIFCILIWPRDIMAVYGFNLTFCCITNTVLWEVIGLLR